MAAKQLGFGACFSFVEKLALPAENFLDRIAVFKLNHPYLYVIIVLNIVIMVMGFALRYFRKELRQFDIREMSNRDIELHQIHSC